MYPYDQYIPRAQKSSLDWITVQNIDQVEKISVAPSSKAWIMVQNEPIFALRQADAMGLATTEYYHFEKYEKPKSEYITADQLTQALERLKGDLNESIISANKQSKPSKHQTIDEDASDGK